ncbi:MAG: hypothetical protein LQ340_001116, partial [Diploschistes diacapsis]
LAATGGAHKSFGKELLTTVARHAANNANQVKSENVDYWEGDKDIKGLQHAQQVVAAKDEYDQNRHTAQQVNKALTTPRHGPFQERAQMGFGTRAEKAPKVVAQQAAREGINFEALGGVPNAYKTTDNDWKDLHPHETFRKFVGAGTSGASQPSKQNKNQKRSGQSAPVKKEGLKHVTKDQGPINREVLQVIAKEASNRAKQFKPSNSMPFPQLMEETQKYLHNAELAGKINLALKKTTTSQPNNNEKRSDHSDQRVQKQQKTAVAALKVVAKEAAVAGRRVRNHKDFDLTHPLWTNKQFQEVLNNRVNYQQHRETALKIESALKSPRNKENQKRSETSSDAEREQKQQSTQQALDVVAEHTTGSGKKGFSDCSLRAKPLISKRSGTSKEDGAGIQKQQETAKAALKVVAQQAAKNAQQAKRENGLYWAGWKATKDSEHTKQVEQGRQKYNHNMQTLATLNTVLKTNQQATTRQKSGRSKWAAGHARHRY